MKSKDQQLLEEACSDVVKKMVAGSNNPGWNLKQGLTSGVAGEVFTIEKQYR